MKQYRLEGRMELLPDDIWGGCDPTIYLPPLAAAGSRSHEVLFWAVDEKGSRHVLAWEGGLAGEVKETANRIRDFRAAAESSTLDDVLPIPSAPDLAQTSQLRA